LRTVNGIAEVRDSEGNLFGKGASERIQQMRKDLKRAEASVRSHSPSQTGRDSGGQGETNQRFYLGSTGLEGTGRDTERHPVVIRLRSKPGTQPRALELKARDGYEKTSSRLFGE
jgi:hypothetical protein